MSASSSGEVRSCRGLRGGCLVCLGRFGVDTLHAIFCERKAVFYGSHPTLVLVFRPENRGCELARRSAKLQGLWAAAGWSTGGGKKLIPCTPAFSSEKTFCTARKQRCWLDFRVGNERCELPRVSAKLLWLRAAAGWCATAASCGAAPGVDALTREKPDDMSNGMIVRPSG